MNLQPLEDRLVVRPSEAEETTVSGLVIPDTAKEKPQQGEVLAVGPGRRSEHSGDLIPMDVAVGDTVLYSKYGGTEIAVDGEDLLVLSSRDVLAKLGGKKKYPRRKAPRRPSILKKIRNPSSSWAASGRPRQGKSAPDRATSTPRTGGRRRARSSRSTATTASAPRASTAPACSAPR